MVQGAGYRFFAMRATARHQVLGTKRNLPDGRVGVIAEGDRDAMDGFNEARGLIFVPALTYHRRVPVFGHRTGISQGPRPAGYDLYSLLEYVS
jgi:acylphosphatase